MSQNLPDTTEPNRIEEAEGNVGTADFEMESGGAIEEHTGETGFVEREVSSNERLTEMLSDMIYDSDEAWAREHQQNHETACIRKCRFLLRNHPDYGADSLTQTMWVHAETGETVTNDDDPQKVLQEWAETDMGDLKKIEVPQPLSAVVEAARDIGYDPTITYDLYRDGREIVTEDNGIGMTGREVVEAYNTTLNSGAIVDGDTGGRMGMGALTFGNITGKQGGMNVLTRSVNPETPKDASGIHFYAKLGGVKELDETPDGFDPEEFTGTRFTIPIQDSINIDNIQDWVAKYSEMLRVPVLYREHENGRVIEKEEYGGTDIAEYHNNPPIQVDRPGEFSIVAGPDVASSYKAPNTWLVSMRIDRNTGHNVKSLWNTAIQIHDEQRRIVHGPHRGLYFKDGMVVADPSDDPREEAIAEVHEDDIVLPEPTGDRDRLQKDSQAKQFFQYLTKLMEAEEEKQAGVFAEKMEEAEHPAIAVNDNQDEWVVFYRMVDYHGPYSMDVDNITDYLQDSDYLPDWDDGMCAKVAKLFEEVDYAVPDSHDPSKKKRRSEKLLGNILAKADLDETFMAASSGGNFTDQYQVVNDTYDNAAVIVLGSASEYDFYEKHFGFGYLKEVPLEQSDEHDFDVSDSIHKRHTKTVKTDEGGDGSNSSLEQSTLKIRSNSQNKKIDHRWTIERINGRIEAGNPIDGHNFFVVFPRGADYENISDHYSMQRFAAITSVTTDEYDALIDSPRVMTYEEFTEWSENTVIATAGGPLTVGEMANHNKKIVLFYATSKKQKRLLQDDDTTIRLRNLYAKKALSLSYSFNEDDEFTVGVIDSRTFERAAYAFRSHLLNIDSGEMLTVRFSTKRIPIRFPGSETKISGSTRRELKQKAETPKWDNESGVYDWMESYNSGGINEILLALHDAGIDPTDEGVDLEELRSNVTNCLELTW